MLGRMMLAAALLAGTAQAETVAIKAGRLIVDAAKPALGPSTVIVENGRIVTVQPIDRPIPAGVRVIDQSNRTVLPGLIDAHVHLTSKPDRPFWTRTIDSDEKAMALGLYNARVTLKAGFTTVRDAGAPGGTGYALRDVIREGMFPGPRIVAAGKSMSIIGGHADVSGFRPEVNDALSGGATCTGAVECAAKVRKASQLGSDVIKITATGGVLSQQGRGLGQHFTDEEMKSIVDTAGSLGLKVMAHAHGARGVEAAARAGVASIDHGTFADEAAVKVMAAKGSWYVPTLMALVGIEERLGKGIYTPVVEQKIRETLAVRGKALAAAVKAGVKIAFGTDSGVYEHGRNGEEGAEMVKYGGMTPRAVLVSATSGAAELLGVDGETGTIEPGKAADLIAVDGDPLADAGELAKVKWVMARGEVLE